MNNRDVNTDESSCAARPPVVAVICTVLLSKYSPVIYAIIWHICISTAAPVTLCQPGWSVRSQGNEKQASTPPLYPEAGKKVKTSLFQEAVESTTKQQHSVALAHSGSFTTTEKKATTLTTTTTLNCCLFSVLGDTTDKVLITSRAWKQTAVSL